MATAPRNVAEAIDLLLYRCPEFVPPFEKQRSLMEVGDDGDIGVYLVFGCVLLPFLVFALDGSARFPPGSGLEWHISGKESREHLREEDEWSGLPKRGSAELQDLVSRLYDVIDLWSTSPNDDLRSAVFSELVEAGYVDLTVEDLVENGGPHLKAMAERGSVD